MKNKRLILKLCIFSLFLFTAFIAAYNLDLFNIKQLVKVENFISSYGHLSAVIFILIFVIRSLFLVLPYTLMVIIGGSIFGPFMGFVFSMVSVFLSASLSYFIARMFGKGVLLKFAGESAKYLDSNIKKYGFRVLFFMRLSSLFPFDLINFGAGLAEIKYKQFIAADCLGLIPETLVLSYVGDNLKYPFSWRFAICLLLIAALFIIPFIIRKWHKRRFTRFK
ncbi:MAG: TVP38/TMEM64 family protein [Bacillota bacterium]|nr:TVP38/TMEM64 family protein [Bacillota bacterium]